MGGTDKKLTPSLIDQVHDLNNQQAWQPYDVERFNDDVMKDVHHSSPAVSHKTLDNRRR